MKGALTPPRRKVEEGTLVTVSDIRPDQIEPVAIQRWSGFGNSEMECAAASIAAYARHVGHWGPFGEDDVATYVSFYRGLPYWDFRMLPGGKGVFLHDLAYLKLYGWVYVKAGEIFVIPEFVTRCLKATETAKAKEG